MAKITFTGSGQLNGCVNIEKTIEIDDSQIGNFTGQNRDEVIKETLQIYYPGVKIEPRSIGIQVH